MHSLPQTSSPWEQRMSPDTCSNDWRLGFLGRIKEAVAVNARRLAWSSYTDSIHGIPLWSTTPSKTLDKGLLFLLFNSWVSSMQKVFTESQRVVNDYHTTFGKETEMKSFDDYSDLFNFFYLNFGKGIEDFGYKWVLCRKQVVFVSRYVCFAAFDLLHCLAKWEGWLISCQAKQQDMYVRTLKLSQVALKHINWFWCKRYTLTLLSLDLRLATADIH